ncbi:hypothetical protein [Flavobacterium limi]|uniref:Insecticide toxin TcdB middle/N-terminal domain-containing protein n=1 Tax=Flavobacterium limi TaxID=2045105 RepID=A0ABQ1U296_9FLAO|nr:hypothetical protein [Flavobacterium limi]GGF09322.1 hypothetical protein GCM10011518_18150 [Flavobacterium limi]
MLRKILISTGGKYFIEEFLPSSFDIPEYPNVSNLQIFAMDFNGDGKDDILRIKPTTKGFGSYKEPYGYSEKSSSIEINCFYRRGTTPNVWLNHKYSRVLVPYDTEDSFPDDDNHFDITLAPLFSRKNKTDPSKMELALLGARVSFFSNNCFSTDQHLLKNITLGNGVKEEITYSPLKNGNGVYEGGDSELYPNLAIQTSPNFNVVSQIYYPNKAHSKRLFKYFGAMMNVEGLGFLGFRATMSTNLHNDYDAPVVSRVSKNNFLLRGANVEKYSVVGLALPSDNTPTTFISKSILGYNSPEDALQSNKVFKLKNTSSIQFDGLTNTSTETITDFDSYKNPLKVTTLVKDNASTVQTTVTDAAYQDPSVTPYIVGRLKKQN